MGIETNLRDLAAEIGRHDSAAADRLSSLADAVECPDEPSGWLGIDVVQAVDISSIGATLRDVALADGTTARLERWRNVLVLIPILLTWIGLMYASFGYRSATAINPDLASEPFLLLWERQFDGLLSFPLSLLNWATLGFIAVLDAAIVLFLIALTVVVHRRQAERRQRVNGWANGIERKIRHAVWEAALMLAARNPVIAGLARYQTAADDLLDEIRAERGRVAEITERREREIADLSGFASGFRTGAKELGRYQLEVKESVETLLSVSTNIETQIHATARQFSELANALLTVGVNLEVGTNATVAMGEQIAIAADLLVGSADHSAHSAAAFAASADALTSDVRALAHHLTEEREAYQIASILAGTAASELREALERLPAAVSHTERATSLSASLLERLQPVVERLTRATEGQERAALAGHVAATRLGEVAQTLNSAWSTSMDDLAALDRRVAAVTERLVSAVELSIKAQEATAVAIDDLCTSVADLRTDLMPCVDSEPHTVPSNS